MRVCPKCEYIDPEYWRSLWRAKPIDYCHIGDFQKENPRLFKKLQNGKKIVKDKVSVYKLAGRGKTIVYRMPRYLWEQIRTFNIPTEKHKKGIPLSQRKLLEVK